MADHVRFAFAVPNSVTNDESIIVLFILPVVSTLSNTTDTVAFACAALSLAQILKVIDPATVTELLTGGLIHS